MGGPVSGAGRVRMTRQARLVDELLAGSAEFRTAQEVYLLLRSQGERIGQTTVYRQLQLLAEHGVVDVIRTPSGEAAYRSCAGSGHHHHLICRSCARTVELAGPQVEAWLAAVTQEAGFTDVSHTLEIVGTCRDCG